jgi:SAM-dependent methyltransferase
MEQRFSFNEAAFAYGEARPGYPDALIDDVISYAGLQLGDRIFEVGCGTGQATESFARRGYAIFATDPGSEMLRGARARLAGLNSVQFSETTFEAWPVEREAFRLIVAAQSWHWVAPDVRFSKAAETLSHGGTLAVFGHVPVGLPPPLLDQFREIYLRHTGKCGPPPEAWYLPTGPFKGWFDASGLFGAVTHRSYPWQWEHNATSYCQFLRSRSDHRMMEPHRREEIIADIAQAIDAYGAQFDANYESHVYIARRRTRAL